MIAPGEDVPPMPPPTPEKSPPTLTAARFSTGSYGTGSPSLSRDAKEEVTVKLRTAPSRPSRRAR